MASPEELRQVLAAGSRLGTVFLPRLFLDDVPRLAEEQDIVPHDLQTARQADLAMQIMALANGYSWWGPWRYVVVGAGEDGEIVGLAPDVLDNDLLQRIVHRFCWPEVPCYFQEGRVERKRVGLIVIADSPMKPFRFACDVTFEQGGHRKWAYHRGEVWVQGENKPEIATAERLLQIKLDAGLVHVPPGTQEALGPLGASEQQIDPDALDHLAAIQLEIKENVPTVDGSVLLPQALTSLARRTKEYRLLVLCGAPGVGKRTLARALVAQLAEDLANLRPAYLAMEALPGETSRTEVIAALCRAEQSIVLVEGVAPDDIQQELGALQEAARRHDSFFLLVSDYPIASWSVPPALSPTLVDSERSSLYTAEELGQILCEEFSRRRGQLLARGVFGETEEISPQSELGGRSLAWIAEQLATPGAAARFAELACSAPPPHKAAVAEAIEAASNWSTQIRTWFERLDDHERYFALAACLCGQLPGDMFWQLYERLVTECWRPHEPSLRTVPGITPRLAVHIGEDLNIDPRLRRLILSEAMVHYTRPLIWALPVLREAVASWGDDISTGISWTRSEIAEAIGALGAQEQGATLPIFQNWATQRSERVRLVAAQALAAAVQRGSPRQAAILDVLGRWAKNEAMETGWVPPRYAHRVRWTAAQALGRSLWGLQGEPLEQAVAHLWTLARDLHPRVRSATAAALRFAGGHHLAEVVGLLGYLAADASKRVRSQAAATLAILGAVQEPTVLDLVRAWAEDATGQRRWTALATLMLMGRDSTQAVNTFVSLAAQESVQSAARETLVELCQTAGERLGLLLPLLERLADHAQPEARDLAIAGLLAAARSTGTRPAVESAVSRWRPSPSPHLSETALRWSNEWARLREAEPAVTTTSPAKPGPEIEEEDEEARPTLQATEQKAAQPAAVEGRRLVRGPQPWVRVARPTVAEKEARGERLRYALQRFAVAAGMALFAYVALLWFPYYDTRWMPVLVLTVFILGCLQPALGAGLLYLVSILAVLYYSPVLAVGITGLLLLTLLLGRTLGDRQRLEKRLVIFGMPILALTPLSLTWPFVIGWLFRKRAAWVMLWGLLAVMVAGVAFGQGMMGDYVVTEAPLAEALISERPMPEHWRSLGWLTDLGMYKAGLQGTIKIAQQLYLGFTETPFPLVQLVLWCFIAWLVGWAAEQGQGIVGAVLVGSVALATIALYAFVFTDILGWPLPFVPGAALNAQILLGCAIVLGGIYGWPALRWAARKVRLDLRPARWLQRIRPQLKK